MSEITKYTSINISYDSKFSRYNTIVKGLGGKNILNYKNLGNKSIPNVPIHDLLEDLSNFAKGGST